jgi:dihydroorotate dehydrogenase electron transfer subunit
MDERPTLMLAEVIQNRNVAPEHFQMEIGLPLAFADPRPGQFVMIRSAGHREPLLARPLSVFGFERRAELAVLELLYRVAGNGTALLTRLGPGDPVGVLGPLGTGFSWPAAMKRALLVAGGVGVAPLAYLLRALCLEAQKEQGRETIFYLGAKTAGLLTGLDHLNSACDLRICTDDGSRGVRGLVTDLLKKTLVDCHSADTALFACGPGPMIRALGGLLASSAFPCQVSLEARMACGLGACLGCAVPVRNPDGTTVYQRVCKDGPVFDLRRIFPAKPAGA